MAPTKSAERKDELGPILKEKLAGLDEQIGIVRNLASEVLKGLEKPESGEDKKVVNELQTWITETLTGALNRLDERISGLVNSGNQQVKAFEGVRLDVEVVKKVGEVVGPLETRLLGGFEQGTGAGWRRGAVGGSGRNSGCGSGAAAGRRIRGSALGGAAGGGCDGRLARSRVGALRRRRDGLRPAQFAGWIVVRVRAGCAWIRG